MKNTKLLMKILVLLSLVVFQVPGMAAPGLAAGEESSATATATIALTITNPLPKATTVTLSGPRSYTLYVPAGATITQNIDAGKYKYGYSGCLGKVKKGNLKLKKTTATLKIAACKMANWSFYNEDAATPVTITMKGWMNYSVNIGPRQRVRVSWVADKYQATMHACGEIHNFPWKVSGKKWWIIYACD
jgi:hypothetical protein